MKSAFILLLSCLPLAAAPGTGDFRINWWDQVPSMQNVVVTHASPLTSPAFLLQNGIYGNPDLVTFGAGIEYDSGSDSVRVSPTWFNSSFDTRAGTNGYITSAALSPYVLTADFTWTNLGGKPTLFDGQYSSLTGTPPTFAPSAHTHPQSDITGLVAALAGKEPTVTAGTTGQYYRGDKTWQTFPSIPAAQVQSDWNAVSGLGAILNKPTLGTAAAQNTTAFDAAGSSAAAQAFVIQRANHTGTQSAATITGLAGVAASGAYSDLTGRPTLATVATTGAYADISGTPVIPAAQVQSDWNAVSGLGVILNKPTNLSSFTNGPGYITGINSAAVVAALGFTPYNATNPSAYITQAGARTAVSLTTTGTSGAASYNSTTGVLNIPNYAVPSLTQNDNVSRSFNSNFTISSTQRARVYYSLNVAWSATALLGSSATAFFEYSTNGGSTWVTVSQTGKSIGLITLGLSGSDDMNLSGEAPANALIRIRTTSSNATLTYVRGSEVLQ